MSSLRLWFLVSEDDTLLTCAPDYTNEGAAPLGLQRVANHISKGLPIEVTLDNIRFVQEEELSERTDTSDE
jgi:hypothetical protein